MFFPNNSVLDGIIFHSKAHDWESFQLLNFFHYSIIFCFIDPAELTNVVHQVIESLIHLKGSQPIRGLATWMTAAQQADYFQPAAIHVQLLEAAALQADSKYLHLF